MNTDTLVDTLARDVRPVARRSALRRPLFGIVAGGVVTSALVVLELGVRLDIHIAVRSFAFWMKWAYTISLGLVALALVVRLGRPEPVRLRLFWPTAIPFVLLAIVGAIEMAHAPASDWLEMWLGHTWRICSWLVLMLSAPIFIGLLWSFRRLAPTRLRAAGAAAGLTAAAWSATLYCLHCPEVSAIFVLTWYTLSFLLAAGFGALVGPRALRW